MSKKPVRVAVTGAAYDFAQPGYSTAALAFGNLRVGATPAAKSVTFTNAAVTDAEALEALHAASHAECFIANSVSCEVRVEAPEPS